MAKKRKTKKDNELETLRLENQELRDRLKSAEEQSIFTRRENYCLTHGHDWVERTGPSDLTRLTCSRCGQSTTG